MPADRDDLLAHLDRANRTLAHSYPGDSGGRQPIHTVYGGADLFRPDTARRLGDLALKAAADHAPDPETLAEAVDIAVEAAERVYSRVIDKLQSEPVEDFRLDFEDGYGNRPDEEEDGHARSAARAVAEGLDAVTLPPFIGIRVKPLSAELASRSLRTLELFLEELVERTDGALPANFVVTLPKVGAPDQVSVFSEFISRLEGSAGIPVGTVPIEIMIETTQSIFDAQGRVNVRRLVDAGEGRVKAAHFGTYDYTAACNITAAYQHMTHPACDFAKHVMQVSLAGTGVWMSDGSTNVLPVPIHRTEPLTESQMAENRTTIHSAWRLHFSHIQHSLVHGFYQGWDLHPAQLVTRYAAVFDFFLGGLEAASERLRNFVDQAAQATLVGEVFDDAATGQGLLNYFLRAVNSGAISEEQAAQQSSLSIEELRSRSFVGILEKRSSGSH
ncbi:MAG: phosphoenolpyruvate kinase [Acidimicrobiia bacterium]